MFSSRLPALLLAGLLFAGIGVGSTAQAADESIHHVSAAVCATCHADIYSQWQGSMHANSTALKDPIHGTMYRKVVGDPAKEGVTMKSGAYPSCLQCHAPNAAKDGSTKLDAMPAYAEGVNCVACHTLKTYQGSAGADGKMQLGLQAYEVADTLQGPGRYSNVQLQRLRGEKLSDSGDVARPNPHLGERVEIGGMAIPALPMQANPAQLRSANTCMGCHDKRSNSHGVPLCATGDELASSKSQVDCLSCHMPARDGLADHSMGGGHDLGMLRRSVVMLMDTDTDGANIDVGVSLINKQPHSLPTGAPFRNIYLKIAAYDQAGKLLWQNAEGHPGKQDPQAFLFKALKDDHGQPAPPPKATTIAADTRLEPFEQRELRYQIPAAGVALVRAELYYNLLLPGMVKKFTHLPKDLTAAKLIATVENTL